MNTYLFLGTKPWTDRVVLDVAEYLHNLEYQFRLVLFGEEKELTEESIMKYRPKYIFSLHWHWKIPEELVNSHYFVGFHSSDLPKFRGGSPIENQIKQGVFDTKLTAFKLTKDFDAGPILAKRDLDLRGTNEEIFNQIEKQSFDIIKQILGGKFKEIPQEGDPTYFWRKDV